MKEGMDKAWAEVKKAQASGQSIVINGVNTIIKKNNELSGQKDELGDVYDKLGDSAKTASQKVKVGLADIKAGIDMAVAASKTLYNVAEKGIAYNSTIEQLKTSFEVMTGSAEKAAEVTERLRVMGAQTPFEMKDLASTTQLLMQYGFTADEALDRMSMLGDVAQGNVQAMNSIALGYAQMSSAGKVNLVDLKQMIQAGFNPLQEISERTGESMASLYDRISKGTMTVDEITESMRNATSEGGRFYQSMEKQSQTLNGQLSTLKDNTDQLLGSVTEGLSEGLRLEILPFANNLVGELQAAFDSGGYQGLVDTATGMIPDLMGMMTGELQKGIAGLSRWLPQGATQLMQALPSALRAAATVAPQLTTALFEVASSVIENLVGMLPELAPVLLEGFGDMLSSVFKGVEGILAGVFSGIESAVHDGQKKIAGVWVDEENVAKYEFDVDVDVDPVDIEGQIAEAKQTVEDTLSGIDGIDASQIADSIISGDVTEALECALTAAGVDPASADKVASQIEYAQETVSTAIADLGLSEELSAKVAEMAASGATESELTEYIKSLGVDEGIASDTAAKITGASNTVSTAIEGLPPEIQTALSGVEFTGDRETLVAALQMLKLDQADIQTILDSYDSTSGLLSAGVTNVFSNIGTMLTDGLPDTEEALADAEGAVRQWASDAYAKIDEWYTSEIESLNASGKTGEEYNAALLDIENKANEMRNGVQQAEVGAIDFMNSMAGKSTAYVQQHLGELEAISQTAAAVSAEIDALAAKAQSAAANAFTVVRSGAKADEATISQAVSFVVTEFKLDEQSAQDAYNATIEELNAQLANNEITKEDFNAGVEDATATRDAAIQAAQDAFNKSFAEIMMGIAESEGNAEAFSKAMEATGAKLSIQDFYDNMFTEDGELDTTRLDAVKEQLASVLGDAFSPEMLDPLIRDGDVEGIQSYLDTMAASVDAVSSESLKAAFGGKVGEAYRAALEDGVLQGTAFDTANTEEQLAAIFGGVATNAANASLDAAASAGAAVGEAATSEEKSVMYDGGKSAGSWMDVGAAQGIRSGASAVIDAAVSVAKRTIAAFKNILGIASPSKVMMELGAFTGEGYAIGLRNSMANAVNVAKQMSGEVVTAAELSRSTRFNIPDLSQEIVLASQQSQQPVNLYVNGRQLGKVMAADNQAAQNSHNRSIALGVGK